jgi:hypothetical protein
MNIPETPKMPSLSGLGKRPQGILWNQGIRGFKSSFQNCFWTIFEFVGYIFFQNDVLKNGP